MDRRIKLFFALFLVFIIFFAFATDLSKRQDGGFFSDESGYYSIIQSLAYDYDIKYERTDLVRIKDVFPAGPVGFFLKKGTDGRLYYAKSFAYPLLAAPFYRLFSVNGLLLLNGLMLFFSILMAYYLLRQYHPQPGSAGFALVFVLASVTPVYIWWMTADLFNFFVMFAGMFFFFYRFKNPRLFYLSGLFFSLSVFSKPFNAAAIAVIYLVLLKRREWKKFLVLSSISVMVFGSFVLFLSLQTGQFSYTLFQGGERRSFIGEYPYDTDEDPLVVFERGSNMSFDGYWDRLHQSPRIIATNFFYYFFGRYTGIFIYFFPACFLLAAFFFQRREPEDWIVLGAITTAVLVFTVLAPDNYFGGSGSVGNRYFMNIYPLFFFLGFRHRGFKLTYVPAAVALVFLSGAYIDSHYHSSTPRLLGASFPIRLFPPEKTQFLSLPTNENHRAYGKVLHDGDKTYQIYILSENFHAVEGDSFWTKADKPMEFFLAASQKVKTFRVELHSDAPGNRVSLDIEYKRKRVILDAKKPYVAKLSGISGLMVKGRYLYHFKIKSSRYHIGAFDKRKLGVMVHIGLDYESVEKDKS